VARLLQGYQSILRYIGRVAPDQLDDVNQEGDSAMHLAVRIHDKGL
jgi:hypothetical protein